jgi:hypothetical protein
VRYLLQLCCLSEIVRRRKTMTHRGGLWLARWNTCQSAQQGMEGLEPIRMPAVPKPLALELLHARPANRSSAMFLCGHGQPRKCVVVDISESGAKVAVDDAIAAGSSRVARAKSGFNFHQILSSHHRQA